jgi:predicted transcriptional regulator
MKAYTLRLEDDLMNSLKTLSRRTQRSMRDIVAEALKKAVSGDAVAEEEAQYRRSLAQTAKLFSRLDTESVVASLREDRAR